MRVGKNNFYMTDTNENRKFAHNLNNKYLIKIKKNTIYSVFCKWRLLI